MRLDIHDSVPRVHVDEWIGLGEQQRSLSDAELLGQVLKAARRKYAGQDVGCDRARRWPGHDPCPEVEHSFGIVEVYRWLTIAKSVTRPGQEIAACDLPRAVHKEGRRIGSRWYEILAYVLLPDAEANPGSE